MATATALLLVIDAMGIPTLEYLIDHFPGNLHFPNLSRLGLGLLMPPRHSCRFYPHGRRICAGRRDQAAMLSLRLQPPARVSPQLTATRVLGLSTAVIAPSSAALR